jgi:hypothetical protein
VDVPILAVLIQGTNMTARSLSFVVVFCLIVGLSVSFLVGDFCSQEVAPRDARYYLGQFESGKSARDRVKRELLAEPKKAVPLLLHMVSIKKNYYVERTLIEVGDVAISDLLRVAAKKGTQERERCDCLFILAKIVEEKGATEENRDRIVNALSNAISSESLAIRQEAAYGLRHLGKDAKPALPQLRRSLKDPDIGVKLSSAEAICNITPEHNDVIQVLKELLEATDKHHHIAAMNLIERQRVSSPELVGIILGIAKTHNDERKIRAIQTLGALGGNAKNAIPYLTGISQDTNLPRDMRVSAEKALASIRK